MIYIFVNIWLGMLFFDLYYLNNIMFVIKGLRQFMSGQGIGEFCVCLLKRESFYGVLLRFYQFIRVWQSDEDMQWRGLEVVFGINFCNYYDYQLLEYLRNECF